MAEDATSPNGGASHDGEAAGTGAPGALSEALERVRELERAHAAAVDEAASLRVSLDAAGRDAGAMRAQVEAAAEQARAAAERHRALILQWEPALPAELIAGDTVDAVDASAATARAMVQRVRTQIEAQAEAARVPAGAPQRPERDLSAMSPQQKIRFGLEQRSSQA